MYDAVNGLILTMGGSPKSYSRALGTTGANVIKLSGSGTAPAPVYFPYRFHEFLLDPFASSVSSWRPRFSSRAARVAALCRFRMIHRTHAGVGIPCGKTNLPYCHL